jgi:hypothetical protein
MNRNRCFVHGQIFLVVICFSPQSIFFRKHTERPSPPPTGLLIRSRQSCGSLSDLLSENDCTISSNGRSHAGTKTFTPAWSRLSISKIITKLIGRSLLFKNISAPRVWNMDNLSVTFSPSAFVPGNLGPERTYAP